LPNANARASVHAISNEIFCKFMHDHSTRIRLRHKKAADGNLRGFMVQHC
jgi:hypothetical protein